MGASAGVQVGSPAARREPALLAAPATTIDAREQHLQRERVAQMVGGAVLLKYQRGEGMLRAAGRLSLRPGEKRREQRLVTLSADLSELRWAKPSASAAGGSGAGASKLRLADVRAVRYGHTADLFAAMAVVPDAAELCFGVETAKRTYCFAVRTASQAETWVVGLSALCGLEPLGRRGRFLWSQLQLRARHEAQHAHSFAALLPRIANELDEERHSALTRGGESTRASTRAPSVSDFSLD